MIRRWTTSDSGKTNRHRLGGNRQNNATIRRIAVTRLRCHPETQDWQRARFPAGRSLQAIGRVKVLSGATPRRRPAA